MSYLHSQQNCHQQIHHHVPGAQDDRPGADMAAAAAAGAVEAVAAAPLERHGHHRRGSRPGPVPDRPSARQLEGKSSY